MATPQLFDPATFRYNSDISSPDAVQLRPRSTKSDSSTSNSLPSFTIRPARFEDAAAIADIGRKVFSFSFGFSIPASDLEAYLEESYTTKAIEEDFKDPQKHYIVAVAKPQDPNSTSDSTNSSDASNSSIAGDVESDWEDIDNDETTTAIPATSTDEVIGFALLTEGTTEPCLSSLRSLVELQRLYVSTSSHGLGVGKHLVREIERMAVQKGYERMWLGVWEGNFRAQKVYENLGYRKVGDHEFRMGSCIQMDWIMLKRLR
jgi:ribosomal protein S18 acetylase RimI-like enzyme